nr:PilZ domain-containing protein [bacterium]
IHYLEGTMPCNFNSSIIDVIELDELSIFKIEGPSGIQKSDRRKHLRMPVFPVCHLKIVSQYSPTAVFTGVLTDISFSGVNIETQKQLNINEPLLLTFQLPKQNGGFYDITDLAIKTIWSKKINSRDFTGCAIQNFKPKQETSISDYLINIQRANNWENHVKKVVGSLIE